MRICTLSAQTSPKLGANAGTMQAASKIVCHSPHDSMAWASHAAAKVEQVSGRAFFAQFAGQTLTISSSCSGVLTPELAAHIGCHAINQRLAPESQAFRVQPLFAVEKNAKCQEEILHLPGDQKPRHVFADQLSFLGGDVRAKCNAKPQAARHLIMASASLGCAWCVRHGAYCKAERADLHVAGTPCVAHSSFGLRGGFDDPVNQVFYAWALQRIALKEPHIIHENVEDFGEEVMTQLLGKWYRWTRVVVTPLELGWPTRRTRQFLHGRLRGLHVPLVKELGSSLAEIIKACFHRDFDYTQRHYCIATDSELEADLAWAESRQKALLAGS